MDDHKFTINDLMQKILIINGSPRKNGNISKMLEAIKEETEKQGANVSAVHVHDLQVRPCNGCMSCRKNLACVLPEDGAQSTLRLINSCDVLVIGAPCYWGNLPGELKILFDRIVYGMMGESPKGIPQPLHKGKKAIIVSTCTTPYPFNILFNQTRGTVKALKEILKWSGFKIVATVERGGTKKYPLQEKDFRLCRKIALKALK